jgi:glucosamine--fructose-6-phosphate aminotransferase (isomerizing)
MCGVIGYVGKRIETSFFIRALKKLEYRGYDSAGIALYDNHRTYVEKTEGKIASLEPTLSRLPTSSSLGIGHTRWATHGKPLQKNAHPHRSGPFTLVHNGIIENYLELKAELVKVGYTFLSDTDTEAAVHALHHLYESLPSNLEPKERTTVAFLKLVKKVRGTFAFVFINEHTDDVLYCAKQSSPLILGLGKTGHFLASDFAPLIEHTKEIIIFDDHEVGIIEGSEYKILDFEGNLKTKEKTIINWSVDMVSKGSYEHYMLKEIFEHPQGVEQTLASFIDRGSLTFHKDFETIDVSKVQRVMIIACGTSFYAALTAKHFLEEWTRLPIDVELSSEARYRKTIVGGQTLCMAISQSGETIDTVKTLQFFKELEAQILSIVNVPGSTLSHLSHECFYTHAGPEIGVASTKAFTSQVTAILLTGLLLSKKKGTLGEKEIRAHLETLTKVPLAIKKVLEQASSLKAVAEKYYTSPHCLFIGRGHEWPIALEGALKLKEISYIHAQGYAGGELKHGPIALIDEFMPVVCLAPKDDAYEKTLNNIQEIKSRSGKIIAIGCETDDLLKHEADDFISLPFLALQDRMLTYPFLTPVALHLFAYYCAYFRETDIDQPKNLAKSVTVE